MTDIPLFNSQIDKTKLPAIHKKRILAFINEFILSTSQFLNDLAIETESKFIVFDQKLNKIQNSLEIIESKLATVPKINQEPENKENEKTDPEKEVEQETNEEQR